MNFPRAAQHIPRQRPSLAQQLIQRRFKRWHRRIPHCWVIHVNILLLSNTIRTISGLIFLGRVPAAGEVDDVVGSLNVDAKANGNGREDDHGEARLILELVDQFLSAVRALAAGACVAVDHGCAESEILLNTVLEFTLDITQFGKENDFVTLPGLF